MKRCVCGTTRLLVALMLVILATSAHAAVIYVKPDSPGGMGSPPVFDGKSWESAYHTLTEALNAAVYGNEIWVAKGKYVGSYTMKDGVALYGGFYGIETSRSQRNWLANLSILDGNQANTVVTCPSGDMETPTYVIDGFTIQNGKSPTNLHGGGICCYTANVTVANCLIKGNTASGNGGGIYCQGTTVSICNNRIVGNTAMGSYTNSGGGIYSMAAGGVIANNTIVGNTAASCGGLYQAGSPVVIANNIIAFCSSGMPTSAATKPIVRNNCSYGNYEYNFGRDEALLGKDGNFSADPKLANYEYGNVHIQADSPCVDAGYDDAVEAAWQDIDRQPRIQGAHVDIGADESAGVTWPTGPYTIVRVKTDGNDAGDGSSWTSAKKTVQAAINAVADKGGEVWVKKGVYSERIKLPAFVHLYGCFQGAETALDQRPTDPQAAPDDLASILDGAKGGTVVTAYSGNGCGRIDGFIIRNGGFAIPTNQGGGILCLGAAPFIANNKITLNSASTGAGIYCWTASPEIMNNVIAQNAATSNGGGINAYCYAAPTIIGNTITSNTAPQGGGGVTFSACRGAKLIGNTISQNSSCGVYIRWSVYEPVVIEGNTISTNIGSGIWCDGTGGIIQGNTITNNVNTAIGTPYGGGIHCSGSANPSITGNTISGNKASVGSGICCTGSGCNPVISSNMILSNGDITYSSLGGGGIASWNGAAPHIIGNTIVGNVAKSSVSYPGGGIYFESAPASLSGNIVAFNTTGIQRAVTTATPGNYRNNCVYSNGNNSPIRDYANVSQGSGDISVDPLFVNRAGGDYHLQPDSPAIDHGWYNSTYVSLFDFDGEGRITGSAMDIGADEYWSNSLSIVDLKKTADGAKVSGGGTAITAVFPGFFYVETADRSSGMRVNGSAEGIAAGQSANVQGQLATTPDGERCIEAASVSVSTGAALSPVGLNIKALGGGDWLYSATYGSGQKGVAGGLGLNNIGLLVKTWGKVTHAGDGWFYLDDGSGLQDGSGFAGVKVLADGLTIPAEGRYAQVTGVSSCFKSGEDVHRLIRATEVTSL